MGNSNKNCVTSEYSDKKEEYFEKVKKGYFTLIKKDVKKSNRTSMGYGISKCPNIFTIGIPKGKKEMEKIFKGIMTPIPQI